MDILAFVFCFNRPDVMERCILSLFESSVIVPSEVVLIDDGSDPPVPQLLQKLANKYSSKSKITIWQKAKNVGFSDSAVMALNYARWRNPAYLFFVESDYVFEPNGLDVIVHTFKNTPQGRLAAGIVGWDAPYATYPNVRELIFPSAMVEQIGEDNVNRSALFQPSSMMMGGYRYEIELHSNTCWTSYINWGLLRDIAKSNPELDRYLDRACSPIDDPNYPTSGLYRQKRVVDDGMLSHALSFFWNRWAVTNRVDRNLYGAWLNIRPTVAIHHNEGGMHA